MFSLPDNSQCVQFAPTFKKNKTTKNMNKIINLMTMSLFLNNSQLHKKVYRVSLIIVSI